MKKSVDAHLMSAQRFVESCDIENAIRDFDRVLKKERGNVSALLGKAECLVHYVDDIETHKNLEDGLVIVDGLIDEHRQSSFDVYFLRARFLWRLGRHNDALKFVGICERFAPDNTDLLETKARIFVASTIHRFKEAEEIMRKLPTEKSNFVKGRIAYLEHRYADAAKLFRQSFDSDFLCTDVTPLYNYLLASQISVGTDKELMDEFKFHYNDEDGSPLNLPNKVKKLDLLNPAIDDGEKFLAKHKNHIRVAEIAFRTCMCLSKKQYLTPPKSKAEETCLQKIIEIVDEQPHAQRANWKLVMAKSRAYRDWGKLDEALVAIDESLDCLKKIDEIGDVVFLNNDIIKYNIKYQDTLRYKAVNLFDLKRYRDSLACWKKLLDYTKKTFTPAQKENKADGSIFGKDATDMQILFIKRPLSGIAECYANLGDEKNFQRWNSKSKKAEDEAKNLKVEEIKSDSEISIYDGHEGQTMEFKSSFYNHGTYENKQEKLQREVLGFEEIAKSVCAFLNSDGGKIVIGVSDDLACPGIEADIQRAPKKTLDGYHQQVRQTIDNMLVKDYVTSVRYDSVDYVSPGLDSKPVKLFEISVEPLPTDEPEFAMVKLHGKKVENEKGKFVKYASDGPELAFFRKGDGDQQYTPGEAVGHWIRRSKR